MKPIVWLHLSDLHFRASQAYDANVVLKALLRDIAERIEQGGLRPDFVAVTGDVAFSGKPAEYDLARQFFDDLLRTAGLGKDRLFLVPGNHDADRSLVTRGAQAIGAALTDRDSANAVLDTPDDRRLMMARFQGYKAFVNDYLAACQPFDDERYFYVRPLDLDGVRVALLGLNSAWLCASDEDKAKGLLIGERQARAALDEAGRLGAGLKIALLHHPFDRLREFDQNDSATLLSDSCQFILHGHLHRTAAAQLTTPDGSATVLACGACYETRDFPNMVNWVRLDPAAGSGTIYLRRYSDERGGFWAKDTLTYRNAPDGEYTFRLPGWAGSVPAEKGRLIPPVTVAPAADPVRLEAAYLRRVQAACNALPLAAIDPRAVERHRQRTMDLLAVYVALDTRTPVAVEEEKGKGKRRRPEESASPERETRPLATLEAVARDRQMVLLGDPGSGKSTFANFLALCLAGARLEQMGEVPAAPGDGWLAHLAPAWTHGPLLPLRVTLRDLAASDQCDGKAGGLWRFIAETLAGQDLPDLAAHLRQNLLDGGVLVLFDGLDEVPDPQGRQAVRDAVADFAATYNNPANRYLVTCRIYAYQDPCCQLDRFAIHTLAPFSQERIDAFVECWYKEVCRLGWKSDAEAAELTRLLQEATRRPDLAPLAASPLQLTMMASLHFSWGRLPDDRAELYQEMVRLLLVRWQEARLGADTGVTQALAAGKLESALEQVAFEAHRAQEGGEGPADVGEAALLAVLKDYLDEDWNRAKELLAFVRERAGLLIERRPGVYTFPHRSYQEYLAGAYLAVQPDFPDQAAGLVSRNYAQWREVALWAVGSMARLKKMTHVAVDAAAALCPGQAPGGDRPEAEWRAAVLAGEALLETGLEEVQARERYRPVLDRAQGWLAALLRRGALSPVDRARAGSVLAQLGDPRFRADAWFLPGEPLLGFVEVPAGSFLMGSDKKRDRLADDSELPQHPVDLPAYYIARYPVTHAQYWAFVQATGHKPPTADPNYLESERPYEWPAGNPPPHLLNHPVVLVTWHDAQAYCTWLTERLRGWEDMPGPLASRLREQGWRVRLPTEAEWEKAARGADGRVYPWGDRPDPDRANYSDTGIGATSAVGCFPAGASPYGVLDLSGNVWEWCQTKWRADYKVSADESPEGGSLRVLRGGSFHSLQFNVRCAYRYGDVPLFWSRNIGFRVVVAPGFPSGR